MCLSETTKANWFDFCFFFFFKFFIFKKIKTATKRTSSANQWSFKQGELILNGWFFFLYKKTYCNNATTESGQSKQTPLWLGRLGDEAGRPSWVSLGPKTASCDVLLQARRNRSGCSSLVQRHVIRAIERNVCRKSFTSFFLNLFIYFFLIFFFFFFERLLMKSWGGAMALLANYHPINCWKSNWELYFLFLFYFYFVFWKTTILNSFFLLSFS